MLKIYAHGSYIDIFVKNTYNGKINADTMRDALVTTKKDPESHWNAVQRWKVR